MAYSDRQTGRSERAVIVTLATALQVGVVAALVNGLAVAFIPQADAPATMGQQIALPPPPVADDIAEPFDTPVQPRLRNDQTRAPAPHTTDTAGFPSEAGVETAAGADGDLRIGDPPTPPLPPSRLAQAARPANDPRAWVTQQDYSAGDIRAERQGTARFTLGIGADGKLTSCTIIVSSGFTSLDAATCKYVSKRAHFAPALDDAGALATGSYTSSIRWVIPE